LLVGVAMAIAGCLFDEYVPPVGAGGASSSSSESGQGGAGGGGLLCEQPPGQGGECPATGTKDDCAYCGNDCVNAACVSGACGAGQVGAPQLAYAIVADTTHVYFHGENQDVFRIATGALDLENAENILPGLLNPYRLLLTDEHLYVATVGAIQRSAKDGTGLETLVVLLPDNADRPDALLLDGDYLYYTNPYPRSLRRISLTGGFPAKEEHIGENVGGAVGLARDDDYLYYTRPGNEGAADGVVLRFQKSLIGKTAISEVVAEGVESPGALVLLGDDLYFSSGKDVKRVPKTATTATPTVVRSFVNVVSALVTDGCDLFASVGQNAPDGEVWKFGRDGTDAVMLNNGVNVAFGGVALVGRTVFHGGPSGLFRIAR